MVARNRVVRVLLAVVAALVILAQLLIPKVAYAQEFVCGIKVVSRDSSQVTFELTYEAGEAYWVTFGDESEELDLDRSKSAATVEHTYPVPQGKSATYFPQLWRRFDDNSIWYCGGPNLPIYVGLKLFMPLAANEQ